MRPYTGFVLPLLLLAATAEAGTRVQFRTTLGDFYLELFDEDKPVTVANFLRYVNEGAYEDSFFHRMVPNFVIQGGLGTTVHRGATNASVAYITTHAQITNEFHVGTFYSNVAGTIAMAKTADPNSATSQFFINLMDNSSSLDKTNNSGGFTVFGRVIGDTNILAKLNNFDDFGADTNRHSNFVVNAGSPFGELPVTQLRTNKSGNLYVDFDDLIYVDVSALAVQISTPAAGGHQVTWNRSDRGTNIVEFTTQFPPSWSTLTNLPAGAGTISVIDPSALTNRFYRVRIQKP
ncbi:MAG TPA: peptidylprolyl isomerase [Candidatus Limnocylindria bacterium]|jgi:cyclophilin family peptidyl-prolyl cis-trans isomerase|nr:peptidylprolyl isomerase [Candidatus Limnocylindria bacterium]